MVERCVYPSLLHAKEGVLAWEDVVDDFSAVVECGLLPKIAQEFKDIVVKNEWGKAAKLYKSWIGKLEKWKDDEAVAGWFNGMLCLAERRLDGEDVSNVAVKGRR